MSWRGRSTFRRRGRGGQEPSQAIELAKPSDEERKQEKAAVERQCVPLGQEREVEGAPAAQGPELETDLRELVQPKTEYERGDDPDVKANPPNLENVKLSEAGKEQPDA